MSLQTNRKRSTGWLPGGLVALLTVALAGCSGPTTPSAPPSSSAPPSPSSSTVAVASPSAAAPSPSASAASPSAVACATLPAGGDLPSDRLVGVEAIADAGGDRVVLTFDRSQPPAGPVRATATLERAEPPFFQGASGEPLPVAGDEFVQLILRGMHLGDEDGPTYEGPPEFAPGGPVLRELVLGEAFEGQYVWIAGFAAGSCVILDRSPDGTRISLDFVR